MKKYYKTKSDAKKAVNELGKKSEEPYNLRKVGNGKYKGQYFVGTVKECLNNMWQEMTKSF